MKNFSIILLSVMVFGCAGQKIKKEELQKVRKIAVIGYTMDYYMDIKSGMVSALMGNESKMGMSKVVNRLEDQPVSNKSFELLLTKLEETGWKVTDAQKTSKSSTLSAYYNQNLKTGYLPLQTRHKRLERKGIPQYHNIQSLKGTGKLQKIAKELQVDALAFVYVDTSVNNSFSIGPIGMGTYKYQAKIILDLINPRSEESIMKLTINGDGVEESKKVKSFSEDPYQGNTFRGVDMAIKQLKSKIDEII